MSLEIYMLMSMVFLAVFLYFFSLLRVVSGRKRIVLDRVNKYTNQKNMDLSQGNNEALKSNMKMHFQQLSKMVAPKDYSRKLELELYQADIPLKGEEFLLINLLAGLVPAFVVSVLISNVFAALMIGLIGLIIPQIYIKRAKQKRIKTFNDQIGDSLVIMANSLRSGFSFLQAIEMVSKEMPAPISDEFGRAIREMNLGTATEDALLNITKRIDSEDLDLVITAVLIQRQTGGNLAEVLDNISQTIRDRIKIKSQIKALTAQGRMSGWVVSLLPVALGFIIYLMNPDYIGTLFTNAIGLLLLVAGVVMQLLGIFFVKKIVDIKV